MLTLLTSGSLLLGQLMHFVPSEMPAPHVAHRIRNSGSVPGQQDEHACEPISVATVEGGHWRQR